MAHYQRQENLASGKRNWRLAVILVVFPASGAFDDSLIFQSDFEKGPFAAKEKNRPFNQND